MELRDRLLLPADPALLDASTEPPLLTPDSVRSRDLRLLARHAQPDPSLDETVFEAAHAASSGYSSSASSKRVRILS